ncbi:hypothetical protein THAOC_16628 [Thalassiosira oceanica]|uniref:Uncharacterized protein n=1 Tax=Thalassiosira oceanica TaxID=159749 RepID=K0SCV5_THAOC|nr:hypothetical protein THAOC_16628 [Thalassiosira oceanica]|eukprot:EJK62744.1 hypothetical protein THAOC_16628 [Thalassiosira oceanica]
MPPIIGGCEIRACSNAAGDAAANDMLLISVYGLEVHLSGVVAMVATNFSSSIFAKERMRVAVEESGMAGVTRDVGGAVFETACLKYLEIRRNNIIAEKHGVALCMGIANPKQDGVRGSSLQVKILDAYGDWDRVTRYQPDSKLLGPIANVETIDNNGVNPYCYSSYDAYSPVTLVPTPQPSNVKLSPPSSLELECLTPLCSLIIGLLNGRANAVLPEQSPRRRPMTAMEKILELEGKRWGSVATLALADALDVGGLRVRAALEEKERSQARADVNSKLTSAAEFARGETAAFTDERRAAAVATASWIFMISFGWGMDLHTIVDMSGFQNVSLYLRRRAKGRGAASFDFIREKLPMKIEAFLLRSFQDQVSHGKDNVQFSTGEIRLALWLSFPLSFPLSYKTSQSLCDQQPRLDGLLLVKGFMELTFGVLVFLRAGRRAVERAAMGSYRHCHGLHAEPPAVFGRQPPESRAFPTSKLTIYLDDASSFEPSQRTLDIDYSMIRGRIGDLKTPAPISGIRGRGRAPLRWHRRIPSPEPVLFRNRRFIAFLGLLGLAWLWLGVGALSVSTSDADARQDSGHRAQSRQKVTGAAGRNSRQWRQCHGLADRIDSRLPD